MIKCNEALSGDVANVVYENMENMVQKQLQSGINAFIIIITLLIMSDTIDHITYDAAGVHHRRTYIYNNTQKVYILK